MLRYVAGLWADTVYVDIYIPLFSHIYIFIQAGEEGEDLRLAPIENGMGIRYD